MSRVIIIQRLVPHYRIPVFAQLHRELGWEVVTSDRPVANGLKLARPEDHAWLHPVPIRMSRNNFYRAYVPLGRIIRTFKPAALVAEFSLQLSSSWQLALGPKRVPFAFWSQGWNLERGFDFWRDRLVQKTRLMLQQRADAQLCYSDQGAAYLRSQLPSGMPICVAHNTIEIDQHDGAPSGRKPGYQLLYVGRLNADKRVDVLIEAFVRLKQRGLVERLVIVGDGPEREVLRRQAGAIDGITLTGAIYDEAKLAGFFAASDLFVVPGSAGLSVNHALAYALPVLLFDDAGAMRHHPEHSTVINSVSGYRIPGAGAEALAQGIAAAFSGPTSPKVQLSENIRALVADTISLDRMIMGFREVDKILTRQAARMQHRHNG